MRQTFRSLSSAFLQVWTAAPACTQQPATTRSAAPNQPEAQAVDPRALEALLDSIIPRGIVADHILGGDGARAVAARTGSGTWAARY